MAIIENLASRQKRSFLDKMLMRTAAFASRVYLFVDRMLMLQVPHCIVRNMQGARLEKLNWQLNMMSQATSEHVSYSICYNVQ